MKKKIFLMLCVSMFVTSTFAASTVGGMAEVQQNQIPELPPCTDPIPEICIEEEETPL